MLLRDKSGQAQILLVPSVMPVQQPATPKPELSAQQPIKPTHSAASAPTQTGIVNRMWRIVKVRADEPSKAESDGLIDKKDDAYVILMDGRVTGTMGCGGLSGTYKLSGNELTLDASAILVDTGCPDLNAPYTSGSSMWFPYKSELRIEQRGNQFLLRDKSGKVQLLLVPY
jgi:heat shock protein HslJ